MESLSGFVSHTLRSFRLENSVRAGPDFGQGLKGLGSDNNYFFLGGMA